MNSGEIEHNIYFHMGEYELNYINYQARTVHL